MTRFLILVLSVASLSPLCLAQWRAAERLFYFCGDLEENATAAKFAATAEAAQKAGYNGVMLECDAGNAFLWNDAKRRLYRERLAQCRALGLKVIPLVWSVGYGSMLPFSPDLVETAPIRGLPYVVHGGKAVFAGECVTVPNAGMEDSPSNGVFQGWDSDEPGKVCCTDRAVWHGGRQSVRFEPGRASSEHARLFRRLELSPYRCYRLSAWIRAEEAGLEGLRHRLRLVVRGGGETLGECGVVESPGFKSGEWRRHGVEFYASTNTAVYVYAGSWGAGSGRFWVDDFMVETMPLTKVPRGAGAAFRVTNARTAKLCSEGTDYRPPPPMTDWRVKPGERALAFDITADGSLREGDELRIDASIPFAAHINDKSPYGQYSSCMSDPALYGYFERSGAAIADLFRPDGWMLSMDEIRAGGTCEACRARHTDMAHILGDCITRQMKAIRDVHPGATVYVWSDMLNPVHNAHDGYYSCLGTFHGSWNLVPKDVVVVCWWHAKRDETLAFFASRGFRTLAAAYYDAKDLSGSRDWLESCRRTPNCLGLMYTTWRGEYGLLQEFGRMLSE